ncbi:MAG TPA: ABC transporter permease [Bryobacteraceae bacterium]|nr:ABC transporter permease [Bryobacteraceae bacterium]
MKDLRYAVRSLLRTPGFAIVAVLTLAIGIGANTAMFTVANAVLWHPLPYPQPEQLVQIWETNPLKHWTEAPASPANFADWQKQNTVFSGMAAYIGAYNRGLADRSVFLTGSGEPVQLKACAVTGNLFDVLQVKPLLGRTFVNEETFEGKGHVAVLSYGLWRSAFGSNPAIVGRTVALNALQYTVVGVMPPDFFFPSRQIQVWTAAGMDPKMLVQVRRPHFLNVIGRLRPGVSVGQARAEMTMIAGRLEQQYPGTNTKMGVGLGGFREWMVEDARPELMLLLGAVGLVLLIVCVNVANLQLGRAANRMREIGIRKALGASRGRLMQQLLTESFVIAAVGGALGLLLAYAAVQGLVWVAPSNVPLLDQVQIDGRVMAFNLAACVIAALLFGFAPAFRASGSGELNDRGQTGGVDRRRTRGLLVASEVAMAVMLVIGAGLLVKSLLKLQQVSPGFNPERVLAFNTLLPEARYPKDEQALKAFQDIQHRLESNPQVIAAGATSTAALHGYTWTGDATVEGRSGDDYERELRHKAVTPGYFRAMGTPVVAGRDLNEFDKAGVPPVTLVNEALRQKYFHAENPVGKRIRFGRPNDKDPFVTIVGVVADQKQDGLDAAVLPEAYAPLAQDTQNPLTFVVRTKGDPQALVAFARDQVHAIDKDLAVTDVTTLQEEVHGSVKEQRFRTGLLSGFAGVALLLAAIGIYGVLAYLVTQRSREIGIRMALGAQRGRVLEMVLWQGMQPVLLGALAGVVGAVAVTRFIRGLLFGVEAVDPGTYALTVGALIAVAMCACYIPARRATRVDPMVALREE